MTVSSKKGKESTKAGRAMGRSPESVCVFLSYIAAAICPSWKTLVDLFFYKKQLFE
ncbi:hypothetical protein [Amphibiibacter pelophylacis]|uniref:Uncharacterized protein n=1 Tax=Amphibiibacter pelophylacis TaxID=1799477 RepID=A0ACC6NZV2_9BURK